MTKDLQVSDNGTDFVVTIQEDGVAVDVSTASALSIVFTKPDGTKTTKTAAKLTDGTDGKVTYKLQVGDLDQDGVWKFQVLVTRATGSWSSEVGTFRVRPNL